MKVRTGTLLGCLAIGILLVSFHHGFLGLIQAKQEQGESPSGLTLDSVDELMKEKSIENCQRAIKGYEQLLKQSPESVNLLVKISNAYITIIDIKTHALIEEKDEYKPILAEYGKIAYDFAEKAMTLNPRSKKAVAAALVAYGYYSSSFGIVKAIFKGASGRYKSLANQLIEIDDTFDGALGYRSLGKLYEVAPWPVGSTRKALKYFKKAVDTDPSSLYSRYYLGLIYFDKDEFDLAKKEFEIVANNEAQDGEKHFIGIYKKKAGEYLSKITRKLK